MAIAFEATLPNTRALRQRVTQRMKLQCRNCSYCSEPPACNCGRNGGISAKQRDQRQATILETYIGLRDDLLHLLAQLAHLILLIDDTEEFHEADPVVRGKRLVGTRVKFTSNLIDEVPEHAHQCSQAFGVNNITSGAGSDLPRGAL